MSERVTMPALGESVTEGTVTRWLKSVGDTVEVDEPLLEVSTDKVDTEIPSPVAGTLTEILAEEDETIEVGADLAVIGDGSGDSGSDDGGESADEQADDEPVQDTDDANPDTGEDPDSGAGSQDGDSEGEASESREAESSADSGGSSDGGDGERETITMPALGESVTEGTVTRWLKAEGDQVEVDEPLLEVSTDKVDTEVPSPVAGTLTKILVGEDETVEVGGELAIVGGSGGGSSSDSEPAAQQDSSDGSDDAGSDDAADEAGASQDESASTEPEQGEDLAAEQKRQDAAAQEAQQSTGSGENQQSERPAQQEKSEQPAPSSGSSDVSAYVTPLVRKLAAQHNIDLSSLSGTGVGGRIRKQDVLAAADEAKKAQQAESAPAAAPAQPSSASSGSGGGGSAAAATKPSLEAVAAQRGSREKMSRLRKVIATRMVESLQTSAQLTTVVEVDVTKVARLRTRSKAEFEQREGTKLSFMPFFALAAIEALKLHPIVNASVEGEEIVYHAQENLGVAVDTEKGLIVPVIKDAGDLNIAGLARKIADLAQRTRTNKITPDELGGGTFTLTNTGSRGALFDTPILNQPQVGILGTGSVVKRPVVVTDEDGGETIAIRSMVYLALTYDHRIVDGADAARFLGTVKARLEEGSFEV